MKYCQMELPDEGLVLVAGRPGMGKSYVMIEMANELNQRGIKSVLVYADGMTSHDIVRYQDGQIQRAPSKLSRVRAVYPHIPYVVEDMAVKYSSYGYRLFLNDYIEHEQPKMLFINYLGEPRKKATAEMLQTIQKIAKEKHVLIFAEINVSRRVERRKDKRPKPHDVVCSFFARRYVDDFVFVYRDLYYDFEINKEIVNDTIEVYSSNSQKVKLPFQADKYAVQPHSENKNAEETQQ